MELLGTLQFEVFSLVFAYSRSDKLLLFGSLAM